MLDRRQICTGIGGLGLAPTLASAMVPIRGARTVHLGSIIEAREANTATLQAAIDQCHATALRLGCRVRLDMTGVFARIQVVQLRSFVSLIARGATILPLGDTGGRLIGLDLDEVEIVGLTFKHQPHRNYRPAVELNRVRSVNIERNRFIGCGFATLVATSENIVFSDNQLEEIGLYPRPAPLDPTANGFDDAYRLYGAGFRAERSTGVRFTNNRFMNSLPAGGHTGDRTGGAGAFTAENCDHVLFHGNRSVNAPGQGILVAGSAQRTDNREHGRDSHIVRNTCTGSNQEGITAFGCTSVQISDNHSYDNRYCSIECWRSEDVRILGNVVGENLLSEIKIRGGGGGEGVIHVVDSNHVALSHNEIKKARRNGIWVGGAKDVLISNNEFGPFGLSGEQAHRSAGVALGAGSRNGLSTEVTIRDNVFNGDRTGSRGDLFAQAPTQIIYVQGNRSLRGDLKYTNAPAAFRPVE